jgi:glycyl-tRNA synthetase (class II)
MNLLGAVQPIDSKLFAQSILAYVTALVSAFISVFGMKNASFNSRGNNPQEISIYRRES